MPQLPVPATPPSPLDCNQPFVFDVPGQRFTWCGVGLCDVRLSTTVNGTMPFVYQVALLNGTIANDGDNITISQQTVTYLNSSLGQPIEGDSKTTTTLAESCLPGNLDGSPVPNGMVGIYCGMAVRVGRFYENVADVTNPVRLLTSWSNPAPNGANYVASVVEAVGEFFSIRMEYQDNGSFQNLGAGRHWPTFQAIRGPVTTQNGSLGIIGFCPFTAKFCVGGPDSNSSLSIVGTFNHGCVIQSNGSQPTVSPAGDVILIPVEIILYGSICCVLDILKSLACVAQPADVAQGGWIVPSR